MSNLKKIQNHTQKKPNTIKSLLIAIPIMVIVLIAAFVLKNPKSTDSIAELTGDLVINKSEISKTAKFYPVKVQGTKLEVLAVKAPDDTIRTAFNTCQVCYSSGRGYYVQEGDVLVCQNCGNRFSMDQVEVTKGGCNPVPIFKEEKSETDTAITISKDYLTQAKAIFANWKS